MRYRKGKFEDRNRFIKCRKCGYIFDINLRPSSDRMDKLITEAIILSDPANCKGILSMDVLTWLGTSLKPGQAITTVRNVTISKGCPFCGNVKY